MRRRSRDDRRDGRPGEGRGALRDTGRATRYDTVAVAVACPPDRAGALRRLLDPPSVSLAEQTWASETGDARATLRVRRSRLPALLRALEDSRLSYDPPGA